MQQPVELLPPDPRQNSDAMRAVRGLSLDERRKLYQELLTIRTLAERVSTEAELEHLVTTGENGISCEHTMWMAKLGRAQGRLVHGDEGR